MMKKICKVFYVILFFAVCSLPLVLKPFYGEGAQVGKRANAELPSVWNENGINMGFSVEFESWMNDALPLRPELLSAAGFVKGGILQSPSSNVISGSDGWLYFIDERQDFMDTNALSDHQIRAAAVTLSLIEEQVTKNGGRFTFVPMPNKSSVYPEHMPWCYQKADENNLSRLCRELDARGIRYTDMLKVMTENRESGVYHRRDTHWNYLGAILGYNAIMNSLEHPHQTYNGAKYTRVLDWDSDLDKLLYPAGGFKDYQVEYDIEFDPFIFTVPAGVADPQAQLEIFMSDKEENDMSIAARSLGAGKTGQLYMVRDSFGRALLPFMIDNYSSSAFVRTNRPDLTRVPAGGDMVYEIGERNLKNVLGTAPFMFAPERPVSEIIAEEAEDVSEVVFRDEGYAVRIFGALPEEADTGDGRAFIRLYDGNKERVFEAFPIYEREELKGEGTKGFSLYLSPDEGFSGNYELAVITGGRSYSAGTVSL